MRKTGTKFIRAYKMKPLFFPYDLYSKSQMLIIFLVIILTLQNTRPTTSKSIRFRGNETDHTALLAIKNQLEPHPYGILSSWNRSVNHCHWDGITCGHKHNRVIALALPSSGLAGTISPYIGNLSFLKVISLYNNTLFGKIPSEIGRLQKLQVLKLENNTLVGEIPTNLSACINLSNLTIGYNALHGKLPKGLGALSKLEELQLHANNFTGPLFETIANITTLEIIAVTFNSFIGTIPNNIDKVRNLTWLAIGANLFGGEIPGTIFNLSSLVLFEIAGNYFEGRFPPMTAVKFPRLKVFNLNANYFSGTIPFSISNFTGLTEISFGDNQFTGSVLLDFKKMQNLYLLDLSYNSFTGDISFVDTLTNCSDFQELMLNVNNFSGLIPKSVVNLSSILTDLWLGGNKMTGRIPEGLGKFLNLVNLDLGGNDLTGTFPHDFGQLRYLELMNFSANALTGKILDIFGNLSLLSKLDLGGNKLDGNIPPSLGKCHYLLHLNLSHNDLSGTVPRELLGGSAKFVELYLQENQLQGYVPLEINNQVNLVRLDISKNQLSGEIPNGLGDCSALQFLNMEGNSFHGFIPRSFASLGSLHSLDLSSNNLSGVIPSYFSKFPFVHLNLSHNKLEGRVPVTGAFSKASVVSLSGNSGLCGGIPKLRLPRCADEGRKRKRSLARVVVIITSIVCAVFVLALGLALWFYLACKRTEKKSDSSELTQIGEAFSQVSYNMLLKATDGFSAENLLGKGSFGSVFKGILDGSTVAIKVLDLQHRDASKSFMAECKALRNIRHRNLVGVTTACSSVDFHGNEFKALVYEFMSNGSLAEWIHEGVGLSLLQRVDVGLDVAYAINYLHHESQTPIVHCDLKPSNVLLDKDMVAHIGDFGLARFLFLPPHSNQSSSISIRGTIGYVAPEYGIGSIASPEGDLYSFGIMLLELMTGKTPTDSLFREDFNLHMFAKASLLADQVMQIVDPRLHHDEITEQLNDRRTIEDGVQRRMKCIFAVISVGVACSNNLPHGRMKIGDAISKLRAARDIFHTTRRVQNLPTRTT